MVTKEKIQEWSRGKVLLAANPNIDPAVSIAYMEMLITAKQLRHDNLKLLNSHELVDLMAEYIQLSQQDGLVTDPMEARYERILELCDTLDIDLGLEQ